MLRWDFSALSKTAIFLDVRVSLSDNELKTNIYEKALNLYLYIPPASMHSPYVLRSIIYGHVYRLNYLCTDAADRISSLKDLYKRLIYRGYNHKTLVKVFSSINMEPANNNINTTTTDVTPQRMLKKLRLYSLKERHTTTWTSYENKLDNLPTGKDLVSVLRRVRSAAQDVLSRLVLRTEGTRRLLLWSFLLRKEGSIGRPLAVGVTLGYLILFHGTRTKLSSQLG